MKSQITDNFSFYWFYDISFKSIRVYLITHCRL